MSQSFKNINIKNNHIDIELEIPLTSQGKFRCKTRKNQFSYGKSFAPKEIPISEESYIEWQIGYDKEAKDTEKTTILDNLFFNSYNKKLKNPYELSEIIWYICENNWISKKEILEIIKNIEQIDQFFENEFEITMSEPKEFHFNKIQWKETTISLPTFKNLLTDEKKLHIEVSLQKQQYATGIQPMLYVIIPTIIFDNWASFKNKTSKEIKYGILKINKENKDFFLNLLKIFGSCSHKHKYDILKILNIIYKNCKFKF